jgi:hypothetical protein
VDRWTGGLDAGFPSRHGHLSHEPDAWIVLPERLIAGHESQEIECVFHGPDAWVVLSERLIAACEP